jgi:G3E family GTPase
MFHSRGLFFLGKTTILNSLLSNLEDKRITVIVNDMSKINIDAQLIKRTEEKMIELSNGCICCTLREDLLEQLIEIGREKRCDYIVIESTGIAEPLHIAETFAYAAQTLRTPPEEGKNTSSDSGTSSDPKDRKTLSGLIKLDTMITVVDLETFMFHFNSSDIPTQCSSSTTDPTPSSDDSVSGNATTLTISPLIPAPHSSIPMEHRTLSHLLIDQIQFADLIILNKCDTVSREQRRDIEGIVKDLNPHAKILHSTRGKDLPAKRLINTGLFSFTNAERHHEWFQTEWGVTTSTPETIEYDITSITFQSLSRPFHPQRLWDFYNQYKFSSLSFPAAAPSAAQPILLRSKGFIWLPMDSSRYHLLHHTGGSLSIQPKDLWWIEKDPTTWPTSAEFEAEVGYLLHGSQAVQYGDRGNTLVLIGQHVSDDKWNQIREELRECLFTDGEMKEMERCSGEGVEKEEWIRHWREINPFKEIISPEEREEENEEEGDDESSEGEDEDNAEVEESDGVDESDEDSKHLSKKRKGPQTSQSRASNKRKVH